MMRGSETERPQLRKSSNSPAPKHLGPKIIPPKHPPPLEHHSSDSSHGEPHRNNGSREAGGYEIRAPPPGSNQEDDTGPSPNNLRLAVMAVKSAVNHFAKVLLSDMNKHPVELEFLKLTIPREVHSHVERANHWKFLVQAFICQRVFEGFDTPNGFFGIEYFENYRTSTLASFADFSKFKDKAATISTLMDLDSPDESFLGRFCFKKFKSISGELTSNKLLPLYKEEWGTVDRNHHPKSAFYQSFLKVAVSVWLLHRLVHAFEQKVDMLTYKKGAVFQRKKMESVVPGVYEEEDEEHDKHTEVGFSVIPGFQVSSSVVKCEVYLHNKNNNRHPKIILPKYPTPLEHQSSKAQTNAFSSSHGEPHRNNGSREAGGYEIRAPPPGSNQEDDTGPSPNNLRLAVMAVKSAVNHFAKVLLSDMNKHPVELEFLKLTIPREVHSHVERANHWKFLVQAFICQRVFEGFDTPNGFFGIEYFENYRTSTLASFADFSKFKDKAATISTLMDLDSPDESFLGRFCFKKFKSISGELTSNKLLPLYKEEWGTVDRNHHPKSAFYQSFLKVAVSVWLLHRLVHAFEQKVDMLTYKKGAVFQRKKMESVVPGGYDEEDEEHDKHTEVGFSVIPGFQVSSSVVKCEVYLHNKNNRHPETETTTGRPFTEKSQSPYYDWDKLYESTLVEYVNTDYAAKVNLVSELVDVFIQTEAQPQGLEFTSNNQRASLSSRSWQQQQQQQQQPATTTVKAKVNTCAESETHVVNKMFAKVHMQENNPQISEEAERKAKKVAAKEAKQREKAKYKAEQDAKIESMMKLLQDLHMSRDRNNTMLQSDARMLEKKIDTIQEKIGKLHEKTEKIHKVSREIKITQVHSKQRRVPRIMLCTERGVNMKQKLLTKLPMGIRAVQLHLLCEQPGQEHIVANATGCEINQKIGERWEKLQPLLATGLQLVAMAVNVGGLVVGVGYIFPNVGRNVWDIQAVDLGRHAVQSRKVQGEQAVADALRAAREEESAAQWLVSYLEKNEVVILDAFGLVRVRYTQNRPPHYCQGSLAWLCSEHHSQGSKAGILESFPVRR